MGLGVVLLEADGLLVLGDGLVQPALLLEGDAEVQVCARALRAQGDGRRVKADRLVPSGRLRVREGLGQVLVDPEIRRVPLPRLFQQHHRWLGSSLAPRHERQGSKGGRRLAQDIRRSSQVNQRLPISPPQRVAHPVTPLVRVGQPRDPQQVLPARIGLPPDFLAHQGPVVQRDRQLGSDGGSADALARLLGRPAFHVQACPPESLPIQAVRQLKVEVPVLHGRHLKADLFQLGDQLQVIHPRLHTPAQCLVRFAAGHQPGRSPCGGEGLRQPPLLLPGRRLVQRLRDNLLRRPAPRGPVAGHPADGAGQHRHGEQQHHRRRPHQRPVAPRPLPRPLQPRSAAAPGSARPPGSAAGRRPAPAPWRSGPPGSSPSP